MSQVLGNVVAASYEGDLTVRSAGRPLTVPALRQTTIVAAGRRRRPVRRRSATTHAIPFDRRYLGDAIALGEELSARVRGFTDNLRLAPGEGRTPGFFRELLPALEDESRLPATAHRARRAPPRLDAAREAGRRGRSRRRAARAGSPCGGGRRSAFAARARSGAWSPSTSASHRTPLLRELDVALGRRGVTPIASPASPAASAARSRAAAVDASGASLRRVAAPQPSRQGRTSPRSTTPPVTAPLPRAAAPPTDSVERDRRHGRRPVERPARPSLCRSATRAS